MLIFKGIHVYNHYGLLATAMYLRNVENGEIEITAMGASDDSLDAAILDAIKSKYINCRFYDTTEIKDNQLDDFMSNYNGGRKMNFKLLLVNSKVNTIDLIVRLNENNPEAVKINPQTIEYKSTKEITERQMNTIKVL